MPQREVEIRLCVKAAKAEKKYTDGARLNPKHCAMGNQQPSSEQEKVQRSSHSGSRDTSDWYSEVVGIRKDEDMICALSKDRGSL